jgi:hypothetical protein
MKNSTKSAPKSAKAPKTAKVRAVSVSFDEFIGLRQLNAGLSAPNPILNRLARKNLVEMTEKYETVLARETKTAIFYKKVVTRNASLTAKGFALIEKLNAAL